MRPLFSRFGPVMFLFVLPLPLPAMFLETPSFSELVGPVSAYPALVFDLLVFRGTRPLSDTLSKDQPPLR